MQNLIDQLLRAGLASKEQVQNAEEELRRQERLDKFRESGELCDFIAAHPEFKDGLRGLPPDTPVIIYPELESKVLWARWPQNGRKLKTGYGSPYKGTILVVRVDPHTGDVSRTPVEPEDSGKRVKDVGTGSGCSVAVVEQSETNVMVYAKLR